MELEVKQQLCHFKNNADNYVKLFETQLDCYDNSFGSYLEICKSLNKVLWFSTLFLQGLRQNQVIDEYDLRFKPIMLCIRDCHQYELKEFFDSHQGKLVFPEDYNIIKTAYERVCLRWKEVQYA